MPHVNIKYYPRTFTDEQRERLSQELNAVVREHFDAYEGAVSIALEPVAEQDWMRTVHGPELTERAHLLIRTPNYRTS